MFGSVKLMPLVGCKLAKTFVYLVDSALFVSPQDVFKKSAVLFIIIAEVPAGKS